MRKRKSPHGNWREEFFKIMLMALMYIVISALTGCATLNPLAHIRPPTGTEQMRLGRVCKVPIVKIDGSTWEIVNEDEKYGPELIELEDGLHWHGNCQFTVGRVAWKHR